MAEQDAIVAEEPGTSTGPTLLPEEQPLFGQSHGADRLWIGQHGGDQDVLVFDPSEADPAADVLTLYSLAQHRPRAFPRATVLQRIQPLTDELAYARAAREYAERNQLRAARDQERTDARAERMKRLRAGVIDSHRRYLEKLELSYEGVQKTGPDHRPGRRTKCHTCGIALDNFADAVCLRCEATLCSCGACGCRRAPAES